MITYELTHSNARKPELATQGSAGYDLFSAENFELSPHTQYSTNLKLKISLPPGYALFILPKSGHAFKNWVTITNSPGLIDSDYPGELSCILINHHPTTTWSVKMGQKIAQGVIIKVEHLEWEKGMVERTTDRTGGLGSTGL